MIITLKLRYIIIFIFLSWVCLLRGQDTYGQLKTEYQRLRKEKKLDSALVIAKQMNTWALQNETDTSYNYTESLRFLGNSYYLLGNIDSSIQFHLLGKKILENNDQRISKNYASTLNNLGIIYKEIGYFDSALSFFYDVLFIREKIKNDDPYLQAILNSHIAECYGYKDNILALQFYLKSLNYFQKVNYNINWCKYLYGKIALTYFKLNNIDSAIHYQREALNIIDIENPGTMDHAISLYNLAKGLSLSNDYITIDSLYNLSIEIALKQNSIDTSFILDSNIEKLAYLLSVEQLELVKNQLNKFESTYEKYDPLIYCKYLNIKGIYYNRVVLNHFASKQFEEALSICRKHGQENSSVAKGIMANLGVSYYQSYQIDKALYYYMKSIEDEPITPEICVTHYNIGLLNTFLSEFHDAKYHLLKAKSCSQSSAMQHSINVELSRVYLELNCLDSAIIYLNFADSLLNEIKTESADYIVPYLYQSANIYQKLGDYQKSNTAIDKALDQILNYDYFRPISAEILRYRIIHQRETDSEIGIQYFVSKLKEYEIKNTQQNFNWLSSNEKKHFIGSLLKSKDFILRFIIENDLKDGNVGFDIVCFSKALLLESSQELDRLISQSSDETLKKEFAQMKQYKKLCVKLQLEGSKNEKIIESYQTKADSLDKILVNSLGEYAAVKRKFEITWKNIQSNLKPTEAAIEFARYFDNKDSTYKYIALVLRPNFKTPELVKIGEENKIQIATQNMDFFSLYQLVWKNIDTLLNGVQTIYYSPEGELNNVSFSAMCYSAGNSQLQNFTKKRGVGVFTKKDTKQSCNTVLLDKYTFHQLTTTRHLADGVLKRSINLNSSISLYGGINYDYVDINKHVISSEITPEEYAINMDLSKVISNNIKYKIERKRSSAYYNEKMEYLSGTKEEIDNISNLMLNNQWKVETRSDKTAGEYQLKKDLENNVPGVLHIATHGFAFPDEVKIESKLTGLSQSVIYRVSEDPMIRCGLMMSGSNMSWTGNSQIMLEQTGEDGILTASEVSNLDLSKTKLVVLSACETGLGKIEGSEGTFGLKRGFKLAGVEQLIVSLWSVPDKETMELMTLFYSDLIKTMNPVTSFEKAQKEMRSRYPTDPEKWAGFVLVR